MTATANLDTRLTDALKDIRKLGSADANGSIAKPKAALIMAQARYDGILTDTDGEKCYSEYLEGRKAILGKTKLGSGDDASTSFKANVSKFTQILKACGLAAAGVNFVDVMTKGTEERDRMTGANEKVKPVFDAYVDLARAQLATPEVQLADEALADIIRKKEGSEKTIVDKLIAAYKVARKLGDEFPCKPMADVVQGYADSIVEAGGEVPAVGKDEEEEAAAMAFLAKRGLTATKLPTPKKGETLIPVTSNLPQGGDTLIGATA